MTEQQVDTVRQLSRWLAATDIALLELSGPGTTLRLRRNVSATAPGPGAPGGAASPWNSVPPTAATAPPTVVRAGSVGIVLHAHPLHTEPLVRPGQEVAAGQPLALLRIGLVLLPVTAPRAGTVARIVAPHGSTAGYGDALVEIA